MGRGEDDADVGVIAACGADADVAGEGAGGVGRIEGAEGGPVFHGQETHQAAGREAQLGEQNNQSRETVRRFIRLTNLIPELLDMVDQKQISFNPAVELSYLTPEEQQHVIEAMDFTQAAPSLSQAQRLKKLSQEGGCTLEAMQDILRKVKKGDLERVAFKSEQLRKYFPKSYSPKQMQDTIIKLLEQWQRKRQREQSL